MMQPLRAPAVVRHPDIVGAGLGVSSGAGWGWWIIAIILAPLEVAFWAGASRDDDAAGAEAAAILGVLVLGMLVTAGVRSRRRREVTRRFALARELAWPSTMALPIVGYGEYLHSYRPAFDVELARTGGEAALIEAIRHADARIVTSAEPGRVRVELDLVEISRGGEDSAPLRFPALADTKALIASVIAPRAAELGIRRIAMGEHPNEVRRAT